MNVSLLSWVLHLPPLYSSLFWFDLVWSDWAQSRRCVNQSRCWETLYRVIQNDCRGLSGFVGVLTTCHTQYTWDTSISIFYLIEQNSKFLLHNLLVYVPPLPVSIPELKVRIRTAIETITADMLQTVWNELDYRVDVCRITKGAHIEHL